ncbi:MAG: hypothetical protein ACPGVP_13735, partial [Thiolinea sp.]
MENNASLYFTETQPLIYKRLLRTIRILWVAATFVLVVSLLRAMSLYFENLDISDPRLSHQLLSSAIFSPYILAVFYAERVAKDNPRLGTQIILLASFAILSVQVLINGDQAVHAMMALPMLMVLAGFFTNIRVSLFTTLATAALVAMLTFIELMGLKPLSPES